GRFDTAWPPREVLGGKGSLRRAAKQWHTAPNTGAHRGLPVAYGRANRASGAAPAGQIGAHGPLDYAPGGRRRRRAGAEEALRARPGGCYNAAGRSIPFAPAPHGADPGQRSGSQEESYASLRVGPGGAAAGNGGGPGPANPARGGAGPRPH